MSRFTKKQLEVIEKLEKLVHYRFSKKELKKRVNEIFGVKNKISIDWNCYTDGGLSDFNAMFSTYDVEEKINIDEELCGDFDIYYLKCKRPNEEGDEVYVTEIGFEFV